MLLLLGAEHGSALRNVQVACDSKVHIKWTSIKRILSLSYVCPRLSNTGSFLLLKGESSRQASPHENLQMRSAAFAGTLAALGQALIPYFTGKIIDFASIDPDRQQFLVTTVKLVLVSLACAVATGIRGGLFTVAMARLNIRIRTFLFASLLRQEQAFYDGSKTGESSCFDLVTA